MAKKHKGHASIAKKSIALRIEFDEEVLGYIQKLGFMTG